MTVSKGAILAIGAAVALAGCGRLGLNDFGSEPHYEPVAQGPRLAPGPVQPLPPVPAQPSVATSDLPPPGTDPNAAPAPGTAAATTMAAAPAAASPPVGRTDLLGGWKLASGGDNCQLFMTLTTWSGGYRATSRGCSSPQLQKISAWDLSGRQVSLKGADGSTVATLAGAGAERFQGQTSNGQPVSISR